MVDSNILYDSIGAGYNTTRQPDPYITGKLFQFLSPPANGIYLDIGCGTGNYTIVLANRNLHFYGVEPSEKMLEVARLRSGAVNWLQGEAEHIPADSNLFDGTIATLTIHHWADLKKGLKEIYRVLKQEGKLVLFTATPDQMKGYWLNHYFPKMMEDSILQMPALNTIEEAGTEAGFVITGTEKYFIKDDLQDLFLYAGKNNPALYLEAEVRKGISSFSAFANQKEVEEGLSKLRADIGLGEFEDIKAKFSSQTGDYLFITMQKC